MNIFAPTYYSKFKCIADKCSHNCCVGWEIDIDEDTLLKYNSVGGSFGKRLKDNITFDDGTAHFVLDGKDYYMDLLFYHRTLRRLVLIELKLGEFEPEYKGQVELYLRWLNKHEKAEGEESPVALILCAEKSQETIELLELDHGDIHVGQYLTKMPPKELLEEKLSLAIANAREQLEQRQ